MDRRHGHRAVLSAAAVVSAAGLLLALADSLRAQSPPAPATATPWVQASPPAASPSREELARTMARRREEELAKQASASAAPAVKPLPVPPRTVPRLSPEENEAYDRNLALWLALPPEEKKELRSLATERVQEETEKAYASSGLNLNAGQREVFALRYRQERRRLEREIQEKAAAERARRLPEIMDRLRREFGAPAMPRPAPKLATPPGPVSPVK